MPNPDGQRETRAPGESRTRLAEIIGEESLAGQRMQAGAILDLMDIAAGRSAALHARSPVVTLSFDRVDLVHPLYHMDLVELDAMVVQVGRSSMTVCVDVSRQERETRAFHPIQRCFVTMVAIDGERRANRNIPAVRADTPEEADLHAQAMAHKQRTQDWQAAQEAARAAPPREHAAVEDPRNREKSHLLPPGQTRVHVRRVFMPRHLNVLGTIFGGDILLWMDRVATYTARLFTGNQNMVTLAMNRIFFGQPIFATDLVEMTAQVTYVRRVTLEVEIEVRLHKPDGSVLPSHSGYFTVLNTDADWNKSPIPLGLDLAAAAPEDLMRYHLARERHRFWQAQRAHDPGPG